MRPLLAVLLLPALASAGENALDFANGALLLSESGSYGIGVGVWAAWRLTDGSEDHGWCSPQGKPRDATFVWELDTTWKLDTLVLSTRHLQESQATTKPARAARCAWCRTATRCSAATTGPGSATSGATSPVGWRR